MCNSAKHMICTLHTYTFLQNKKVLSKTLNNIEFRHTFIHYTIILKKSNMKILWWKSEMFKKENLSYLKTVSVTFYIGIFCYIMYTCIPIQCPPNNGDDSLLKQEEINKRQNTTTYYGLNFELKYVIRFMD